MEQGWQGLFGGPRIGDQAGRPSISTNTDNVTRVRKVLNPDRRLSISLIAHMLNLPKAVVHDILTKRLNMRKVCTMMVPKPRLTPPFFWASTWPRTAYQRFHSLPTAQMWCPRLLFVSSHKKAGEKQAFWGDRGDPSSLHLRPFRRMPSVTPSMLGNRTGSAVSTLKEPISKFSKNSNDWLNTFFFKLTQSYYFPDRTCVYALPPCHTVHPAQKMKFLLKMYFLGRIQHQQRKTFGKGMVFHQLSRQRLGRHTGWKKSLKKSNEKDQNLNQVKRTPQRNSGWSRLILSSSKGSGVPRYYLDTYLFKLYSMSFRYLITVEWSDSILYLNFLNCRPAKRPGQNLSLGN